MNHGYVGELSDFNKITVGHDTDQEVLEKVGPPMTSLSGFAEDGSYSWFYASKKTEKNGFLDPKIKDQKAVVVSFDSRGVVKAVSVSTNPHDIEMVKERTESGGKTAGIAGEWFGGLGKYRKQFEDSAKK
jgi:outer membrane protein assembly factor BamE (lipoprotein component of BamABCDE complex)